LNVTFMTAVFPNPAFPLANWVLLLLAGSVASRDVEQAERASLPVEADDHELMARLKAGDGKAFEQLFDKWKRPLISFFYRSTGDYHQAEDLTLEVAMKVYRARDRYQPRARFSTWLFQIAHNRLRDQWRLKRPVFHHAADGELPQWDYPETAAALDPNQVLAAAIRTSRPRRSSRPGMARSAASKRPDG
jgi:RNA polymerase sigma factor (sigma-70 family)